MPSIISHTAIPLAIGLGLGSKLISKRLIALGVIGSVLPDLDVLAFHYAVPYASIFGHRGLSHSLLFAFAIAFLGAGFYRYLRADFFCALAFLFISISSHGVLDSFTTGGLGIALLWPWSEQRYIAPYRVIAVSPIGISRFISERGLQVLRSEFIWIWIPSFSVAFILFSCRYYLINRHRNN